MEALKAQTKTQVDSLAPWMDSTMLSYLWRDEGWPERAGGVPTVGSHCVAKSSEDVEDLVRVTVNCEACELAEQL
jgi:hypothetical protein